MQTRLRTVLGVALLVLAFGFLAFWLYGLAIISLVGGLLALFWRRAPRPLW